MLCSIPGKYVKMLLSRNFEKDRGSIFFSLENKYYFIVAKTIPNQPLLPENL